MEIIPQDVRDQQKFTATTPWQDLFVFVYSMVSMGKKTSWTDELVSAMSKRSTADQVDFIRVATQKLRIC